MTQDVFNAVELVQSLAPPNGLPNPYECRLSASTLANMNMGPLSESTDTRARIMRDAFDNMQLSLAQGRRTEARDAARLLLIYLYNEAF